MIISHHDPRLSWHGHVSLERTGEYTRPWRIPFAHRSLFAEGLANKSAGPAGVRLAFLSDTRRVAGRIVAVEDNQKLDLCVDGQLIASVDMAGAETFCFADLPAGAKRIELWLPQGGSFALREIEVDEGATFQPAPDERPRWITYGSSITHCGAAASPTQTWPAIVARERNLNLTCLGFSGQCHLDAQIARTMRDLPADYISICAGINIFGGASLNVRSFEPALIGFVQILREKHPATPLLLISPIFSFERETTANAVGWTLGDYRNAVAVAAAKLREAGDNQVHYLDGLTLFGENLGHLLPDHLHPDAEGYKALAANFLLHVAPILFDASA